MTFDDNQEYSRLEAMQIAKEQALIRENAANYVRDGLQIPDGLVLKYDKALRSKLCVGRSTCDSEAASAAAPVAAPVAAPAAAPPAAPTAFASAVPLAAPQPLPITVPTSTAAAPAAPAARAEPTKCAWLTTTGAEPFVSLVSRIPHGISLNGPGVQAPLYPPQPAMSWSWSGTRFAQASGSPMVFAVAASSVPRHLSSLGLAYREGPLLWAVPLCPRAPDQPVAMARSQPPGEIAEKVSSL